MKTHRIIRQRRLIAATSLALPAAQSQEVRLGDIKRTNLMKEDLSVPGREVVQVLVEFAPGVVAARHSHPGEELVYVIEGVLEYQLDGRPPVTRQGRRGAVHPARNASRGEECRQRQRGRARHLHRRKRQAASRAGQVNDASPISSHTNQRS